jgi:tRNA G18 (ribose-2'-O)-methylase SpoU
MTPIDDPADPRLAHFRLLADHPLRHDDGAVFVVEGLVAVRRLVESEHTLRSALIIESRRRRFADLAIAFEAVGAPVYVVRREVMATTVGFDLHRGVLASAERGRPSSLDDVLHAADRIAVLVGLNDAENVGLIARAARALGVDALVLDPTCTDPFSRRTIRVSQGEVLLLPVARVSTERWPIALDECRTAGFETWAMTPSLDADDLWGIEPPPRVAVLLGAEGPGLDAGTMERTDRRVRIPIAPTVDSLNVGHAAAITFAALSRAPGIVRSGSSPT